MEISHYFLLPDGRLRAGWRLAIFVVFFLIALVAAGLAASLFVREPSVALEVGVLAATTGAATWLMMRFLEHQSVLSIGLVLRQKSFAEVRSGLGGGIALVGGVTVVEWGIGAIRFDGSGTTPAAALPYVVAMTALLSISAMTEEVLFRGYAFQRLVEGSGGPVAVAISSLVFGGLHAGNPHATRLSILNTMLAGALLALAYLKTRALWLPIGFHFSWNWTLLVLGHPVSGLEVAPMPWRATPASELIWLHGGSYGPEGGVVATAALFVGILYLVGQMKLLSPPSEIPSAHPPQEESTT